MMTATSRWTARIDRLSERLGQAIAWLVVLMILVGAFNAIVRYMGRFTGWNLSSNAYLELQWYLFSAVFLLGASDALRRGAHVRVDVFYSRLSARGQSWIDVLGTVLFLMPFALVAFLLSLPSVRNAWLNWETSPDPGGLARYPVKTLLPIAFALLLLQGTAELFRHVARLRNVPPGSEPEPHGDELENVEDVEMESK